MALSCEVQGFDEFSAVFPAPLLYQIEAADAVTIRASNIFYLIVQTLLMMNMGIFQLFFNYLEERPHNNVYQNVKQDADYLEAMMLENKLNTQYQQLELSDEHRKIIMQWIDAIQTQESAYTAVVFRMGMQFCFSLLAQLADL